MSKPRPLLASKGSEIEKLARDNWNDDILLSEILDELGCRRRPKAVQLAETVRTRLVELRNNKPESNANSARFEGCDILVMVGYDNDSPKKLSLVERHKILHFVNELSREKAPPGAGGPRSATRRLLVLECLSARLQHARKTRTKTLIEKIKEDIVFVEREFF